MLEPRLLILDETLSALDPVEQGRLLDLFAKLQAAHRLTYLFISHDLAMVRKVCSRIAVMYLGKIVELADNGHRVLRPGHPYTRALLSAVPVLEEQPYKAEDCLLEGEPPSPIDIPPAAAFAPGARSPSIAAGSRSRRSTRAGLAVSPPAIWSRATSRHRRRLEAREESHGRRRHRGGCRCRRLRARRPAQRGP